MEGKVAKDKQGEGGGGGGDLISAGQMIPPYSRGIRRRGNGTFTAILAMLSSKSAKTTASKTQRLLSGTNWT
jgi:hypothetical protein